MTSWLGSSSNAKPVKVSEKEKEKNVTFLELDDVMVKWGTNQHEEFVLFDPNWRLGKGEKNKEEAYMGQG